VLQSSGSTKYPCVEQVNEGRGGGGVTEGPDVVGVGEVMTVVVVVVVNGQVPCVHRLVDGLK